MAHPYKKESEKFKRAAQDRYASGGPVKHWAQESDEKEFSDKTLPMLKDNDMESANEDFGKEVVRSHREMSKQRLRPGNLPDDKMMNRREFKDIPPDHYFSGKRMTERKGGGRTK